MPIIDNFKMLIIDFWDNHRHIRCKTVSTVIRNNWALCLRISFFQSLDFVLLHINSTEYEVNLRCDFFYICSTEQILAQFPEHEFLMALTQELLRREK